MVGVMESVGAAQQKEEVPKIHCGKNERGFRKCVNDRMDFFDCTVLLDTKNDRLWLLPNRQRKLDCFDGISFHLTVLFKCVIIKQTFDNRSKQRGKRHGTAAVSVH